MMKRKGSLRRFMAFLLSVALVLSLYTPAIAEEIKVNDSFGFETYTETEDVSEIGIEEKSKGEPQTGTEDESEGAPESDIEGGQKEVPESDTEGGSKEEPKIDTEGETKGESEAETKEESKSETETIYTLHLTHYFRFTVNGEGRNVRAEETIELTEADFKEGICDLSRFAYDVQQLTVTEANPLSMAAFDENHEGGARIVYAVSSGWKLVPVDSAGNEGIVLRDVFQGGLSDYEFEPANVIRVNMKYQYSSTGGLAGINAASPEILEVLPEKNDEGKYEFECELPVVEGFRIVLDPDSLNKYLVNPPQGDETPEQLKKMLENGDFNGDIENNFIYYYQEYANDKLAAPDYNQTHPTYKNRYSTEYNLAWNAARIREIEGESGYTAAAICGGQHNGAAEDYGANALKNPKLKVTLTEAQLNYALENSLDITVSYRRNATWYTVNHWVPTELSGLPEEEIAKREKKTVGDVEYVLCDVEKLQGRVGSLTRVSAKTGGVYELLAAMAFSQKLIEGTGSIEGGGAAAEGTIVDIYYKAADFYRIIFDTDYTYIPRQHISLGRSVNFENMAVPKRKGYTFGGWQYLKKDAKLNENGEYDADAYETVGKDENGNYTLLIDNDLVTKKAMFKDIGGVLALHLYPIWIPDETQVRVLLWTEDLTGIDDVQASATGGNPAYYNEKYKDYEDEPVTHRPVPQSGNVNYSNIGSFTVKVQTDASLLGDNADTLLDKIQTEVEKNFGESARDTSSSDVSKFYTQDSFEILHESGSGIDYTTTTANADGKTMIYVYFTRNVYTLKFHYYGRARYSENTWSDLCAAVGTNGYSYAGVGNILDENGELIFDYHGNHPIGGGASINSWVAAKSLSDINVPETITIKAKYGADLRSVWPVARLEEAIKETTDSRKNVEMCSWATTQGKYRDEAMDKSSSHFDEATVMGLYATMDDYIIGDPGNPEKTHHLIAYWSKTAVSVYRLNHCYELPGLDMKSAEGVKTISIYNNSTELRNTLYLVPADNGDITKFGFTDLLRVSYDDNTGKITYDTKDGGYYAVRGYLKDGTTKYYAVGRQVSTVSTNAIEKQNPSARAHMTRANHNADHTTKHADSDGMSWAGNICGTKTDPYDLYFYYDRDRYTITYMATNTNASDTQSDVELGHIDLPYGTHVTEEKYAFQLDYRDTNKTTGTDGKPKYLWTYPEGQDEVPVCPDRAPGGNTVWKFKGWGLGPAGINMQWKMKENGESEAQAQAESDFYIGSDLLLYAIWETPMLKVTFHLNGGVVGSRESVEVLVPANTRFTATGTIPRPFRSGYTMEGWYQSDEYGNAIGTEEKDLFDFDTVVIENLHVAAVWKMDKGENYNYNVYYVTSELNADDTDKNLGTVQINDEGKIVEEGGKTYYVLEKAVRLDQVYMPNTVLNLTAKLQAGYIPVQTNKTVELAQSNVTYDIIFYYIPQTTGSYTVNFVEAGTETAEKPTVVQWFKADADQTVVTPDTAAVKTLTENGYKLVNKDINGNYTEVNDYKNMTWLDKDGNILPMDILKGDKIPEVVTYLVEPIIYKITYKNADGSPAAAETALSGVTAPENTPVESAGDKNPTQYTVKNEFTLKNPERIYDAASGKSYDFSHWSLGDGTTVNLPPDVSSTYETLTVNKGTIGNLTFIANWIESAGSLKVTKTVAGDLGNRQKDFSFTVTLSDTSINDTYGDMTFRNGKATFTLKHNEQKIATDLPGGITYAVTETADADYDTTSTGAAGVIKGGETVTAAFTNTRKETVNTGIRDGMTPWKTVAGLFMALLGAGAYIVYSERKRRKQA